MQIIADANPIDSLKTLSILKKTKVNRELDVDNVFLYQIQDSVGAQLYRPVNVYSKAFQQNLLEHPHCANKEVSEQLQDSDNHLQRGGSLQEKIRS